VEGAQQEQHQDTGEVEALVIHHLQDTGTHTTHSHIQLQSPATLNPYSQQPGTALGQADTFDELGWETLLLQSLGAPSPQLVSAALL
jgi:hypothetical protein